MTCLSTHSAPFRLRRNLCFCVIKLLRRVCLGSEQLQPLSTHPLQRKSKLDCCCPSFIIKSNPVMIPWLDALLAVVCVDMTGIRGGFNHWQKQAFKTGFNHFRTSKISKTVQNRKWGKKFIIELFHIR